MLLRESASLKHKQFQTTNWCNIADKPAICRGITFQANQEAG